MCLGDACFSGDEDANLYEIVLVEDLYFYVQLTTVAEAWVSTDKITWVGFTPYIYIMEFPKEVDFATL